MTSNGNGTKTKKPRPQPELELATMRHCRNLIMRLAGNGSRQRVIKYLEGACFDEDAWAEPAPIDPPSQLKIPGSQVGEELPFE